MTKYNGSYIFEFESNHFYNDDDFAKTFTVDLEYNVKSESYPEGIKYHVDDSSISVIEVLDEAGIDHSHLINNKEFKKELTDELYKRESYLVTKAVD